MPGQRLKTADLAARFAVSPGVIREALNLLGSQELVRVERNKGFHVMSLSLQALSDLFVARRINEGAALRLSLERGDTQWESEVVAAHHRLNKLPAFTTGEDDVNTYDIAWGRAHAEFHLKLIEGCMNPVLLDICARLSDAAEVYRAWALPPRGYVSREYIAEHESLLDAALARDADLAVSLMVSHLDRTRAALAEHVHVRA